MIDSQKKAKYNNEPVHYCTRCLSLKVMRVPLMEDLDYCDKCGSTLIDSCNIVEWLNIYRKKYGFDYLNNKI